MTILCTCQSTCRLMKLVLRTEYLWRYSVGNAMASIISSVLGMYDNISSIGEPPHV
ncbi:uncharacterized protein EI97DRAFT_267733 [Westerdykella ornata]|uniref:Uncharacterized protein n=1 Tax=Westerdykella ornata TaxID=318751 RepID=A0A6A6J5K6_WESOR|nr:uncharacterized protein EI97DRAFT_267733 [Westerdykella ornata]KAF2271504.1 hypothetical protein EI97DRAFT_267733 [Westerdykella ornata]